MHVHEAAIDQYLRHLFHPVGAVLGGAEGDMVGVVVLGLGAYEVLGKGDVARQHAEVGVADVDGAGAGTADVIDFLADAVLFEAIYLGAHSAAPIAELAAVGAAAVGLEQRSVDALQIQHAVQVGRGDLVEGADAQLRRIGDPFAVGAEGQALDLRQIGLRLAELQQVVAEGELALAVAHGNAVPVARYVAIAQVHHFHAAEQQSRVRGQHGAQGRQQALHQAHVPGVDAEAHQVRSGIRQVGDEL